MRRLALCLSQPTHLAHGKEHSWPQMPINMSFVCSLQAMACCGLPTATDNSLSSETQCDLSELFCSLAPPSRATANLRWSTTLYVSLRAQSLPTFSLLHIYSYLLSHVRMSLLHHTPLQCRQRANMPHSRYTMHSCQQGILYNRSFLLGASRGHATSRFRTVCCISVSMLFSESSKEAS